MNQEQTIQDILEVVTYLKNNMMSKEEGATKEDLKNFATKDDLREIREEMKNFTTKDYLDDRLSEMKNDLMNHIDGFIGLHHKLDIEFTSLRSAVQRMEEEIQEMKKQMQMN